MFTALDAEVTLLDLADRVLPFMDAEISDVLATAFADMGMRLALGLGVGTFQRVGGELRVTLASGQRLHPEKVLFGAGRAGATEGLGLQEAGVKTDARGRIVVDDAYRTTAEGIYLRPATPSGSHSNGPSTPSPPTASAPSPRSRWWG